MAAIVILSGALSIFAGLEWQAARRVRHRGARILLRISSAALLPGMLLAAFYGLGEFLGLPWIDLTQMARWHGAINGLGITLAGTIGWQFVFRESP